jgi:hypothetical protein
VISRWSLGSAARACQPRGTTGTSGTSLLTIPLWVSADRANYGQRGFLTYRCADALERSRKISLKDQADRLTFVQTTTSIATLHPADDAPLQQATQASASSVRFLTRFDSRLVCDNYVHVPGNGTLGSVSSSSALDPSALPERIGRHITKQRSTPLPARDQLPYEFHD